MRIYEFASDQSYFYIVSEYIPKGELFDEIIKRKFLNEEDGAYVIRQLLSAITYCHAKGIVHRDLKPENILIDSISEDNKINIKVIDFGTAMFYSPDVELEETLGTPYYVAPEVLMGNYTEKCDVWSIGVILYVLLSGTAPFDGKTDEEILGSVKRGKLEFRSKVWIDVSNLAKDLIKKLLTYNPSKRPSAAEAFKHSWIQNKNYTVLEEEKVQDLILNMSQFCVNIMLNLVIPKTSTSINDVYSITIDDQ